MSEPASRWRATGDWVVGVLASPRALQWGAFLLIVCVVALSALYLFASEFGFDNVMDRLGLTRPPIEQLRAP